MRYVICAIAILLLIDPSPVSQGQSKIIDSNPKIIKNVIDENRKVYEANQDTINSFFNN